MVKSIEMDEAAECLNVKTNNEENIEQLHHEINLHIEDDGNATLETPENIDELKSSLFNETDDI
jgi:hypothetical protein